MILLLSSGPEKLELLVTAELCSFFGAIERGAIATSKLLSFVKVVHPCQSKAPRAMLLINFLHSTDLLGPKIR